jgi:hypothetical protein
MDNTYFGAIAQPDFFEWDEKRQNLYLLELGLFNISYSISTRATTDLKIPGKISVTVPLSDQNKKYICNTQLANSIYHRVLNTYGAYLKNYTIIFNTQLTDLTFGLDTTEIKRFALKEFNTIYKNLNPGTLAINGRFEVLSQRRQYLIRKISEEREIVMAHLTGKEDFFNVTLYESNQYLQSVIEFEGTLEILLDLNKRYEFETDKFFSGSTLLSDKYSALDNPSFDIHVFQFIDNYINSITKHHFVHVVSLFYFLKTPKLIKETADQFRAQINQLYPLNIGKLKLADSSAVKHKGRMELLKKKWGDFQNK